MDGKMDVLHSVKMKSWQIPHRWVVAGGVLSSMTIQLLLVYGGAVRHRFAHWVFTSVVWLAYVSSDSVAESALGSMFHSSDSAILFAIWSPLLLLHLGGPDTITAYSLPDNQLWLRHLVNMIYQTIVAVYVLCFSTIGEHERHLVGAALLVFFAGCSKYTERTCALCFADRPKIVRSTRNIYIYMQTEHRRGLETDVEMGDVDKFSNREDKIDVAQVKYNYIVVGEENLYKDGPSKKMGKEGGVGEKEGVEGGVPEEQKQVQAGGLSELPDEVVTVHNVWEHEGQQVTENYIVCVSHALFKMYKRRLVSLRLHEAYLKKTRRFFVEHFNPNELFRVVELELKFLYDYLFSKSSGTAFSSWGVAIRVLNTSVLGLALFLVGIGLREKKDEGPVERMATYILLFVAISVEIVQLSRLLLSDWSMVWLICADVRCCPQPSKTRCSLMDKLIPAVIRVAGWGRKFKFGRGKYWKNQIQQLSYTEICFSRRGYPLVWKVVLFFLPVSRILALPLALILPHNWYMACYMNVLLGLAIKAEPVQEEFKRYFFDKIKETSGKEKPIEDILSNFQNYLKDIQDISNKIHKGVENKVIPEEKSIDTQEVEGDEKKEAQKMISSEVTVEEKKEIPEEIHEQMVEIPEEEINQRMVEEKKEIPEEIQEQREEEKRNAPEEIHELMVEEKMEKAEDISSDIQEGIVDEKKEIPEETSKMEERERPEEIHEQMVKKMEIQQQMGEEKVGKPEETSKVEEKERKPLLFELKREDKENKLKERKRLLMFRGRDKGKGAPRTLALEDLILAWHVSTAILVKLHGQSRDADVRKNVRLSRMVSNYCIYMIVSCPRILPVHPDNARKLYTDAFSKLDKQKAVYRALFSELDNDKAVYEDVFSKFNPETNKSNSNRLEDLYKKLESDDSHTLKLAKGIVKEYHDTQIGVKEMWEELADKWAKLFMYLALYDKSSVHEEQLTKGGEFITLIWVIMGHMGLGEATYAASGMKIG